MDLAVAVVVRRQVASRVAREHLERQRLDLDDPGVADPPAGKLARQRLERAHHLEVLADVVLGQRDDLRAAIGVQRDESIGFEQPERLAQRRARHAELHAKGPAR